MKNTDKIKAEQPTEKPIHIGKALLAMSFLPLVYVIIYAVNCAIDGFRMFSGTEMQYGKEAFQAGLLFGTLNVIIVPVLPAGIIYQLAYFTRWLTRKIGISDKKSKLITAAFTGTLIAAVIALLIYMAVRGI